MVNLIYLLNILVVILLTKENKDNVKSSAQLKTICYSITNHNELPIILNPTLMELSMIF